MDRIVVQYGDQSLKGHTDRSLWRFDFGLTHVRIHLADSELQQDLPLQRVKAIFFVKSFDGRSHEDLRFHDDLPHAECLWVRITFHDGEVMEGLIKNSCEYVLHDGFFLSPIDPEGNNWLVYAFKKHLRDFHVLGLRPLPRALAI